MRCTFTVSAIALAAAHAGVAGAQSQPPVRPDTARVAVRIFAEASAREVRFTSQPELRVRLEGGLDSIHVIERRNLPSPIVMNTTYRDVYVAVEIFGRVNAECIARTLRARLGDSAAVRPVTNSDCASLEMRGASARPPADSGRPPRR
jgi:hypothetical protein